MERIYIFLICAVTALQTQAQDANWRLVWAEEFNRDGAVDSSRWGFEYGFVRNRELQWYQPQNAEVKDGCLRITGRAERVSNPRYREGHRSWQRNREYAEFTSSCIKTAGHYSFLFGRLEVRARIPVGGGAWPAIWTLGEGRGWPACGEIDVMEFYRVPPAEMGIDHRADGRRTLPIILANACWAGENGRDAWNTNRHQLTHFTDRDPDWASRFHTWRMDWSADSINLYLDDERLAAMPNTLPHIPHYILLNLAIGASGGTPDQSAFPMLYEVDYVRVYQKGEN
ncbi:MAG: glycoside hydrolase family 16 protein [Bacteroidaceae bacterium]|nr:glycoside hydrolase family 16 protein [Bacteroidaceae bacterium]